MDSVVSWIFLWLIPTLSLNKIKIMHRFLLFGVPTIRCVSSHTLPRFDFNCVDGLAVFIPAYAAASAFVACCISTIRSFLRSLLCPFQYTCISVGMRSVEAETKKSIFIYPSTFSETGHPVIAADFYHTVCARVVMLHYDGMSPTLCKSVALFTVLYSE
jgi:hypothetical protein